MRKLQNADPYPQPDVKFEKTKMGEKAFVLSYLSEPVKEGLGKAFASSSLCERVLAAEDLGLLMLNMKAHAQLRDVNLSTMVKASI